MRHYLLLFFIWSSSTLLFSQQRIQLNDPPQSYKPMVSKGVFVGNIRPLRDLPQQNTPPQQVAGKLAEKRNFFFANEQKNPDPQPKGGDPLVKNNPPAGTEFESQILPEFNFEGIRDPNVTPPDPTGDIGKNHYVQMVNTSGGAWFQVWDKVTGQSVFGPTLTSTIWSEVGSGSLGDPIIQYDHDAERWLMMELQGFFTNELLLAISDDSDPTGGWKAYRIQTLGFGDYPKLYVWPNAYMITVNEIVGGNECSGYALNRQDMLNGEATVDIFRFVMPNYQAIAYQPATGADWEGGPPPPAGSPAYIFRVYDDAWDGGQDHLQIWEVNVDWNNPGLSNITGPDRLYPTPFETKVCWGPGLFDCIEQPDPGAPRITALENIIMYRAPYRNFGSYESVVFNHVSDVSGQVGDGGDAAVRWYELRKTPGGEWSIYQEGTFAPDLVTNRFMGTICTDEAGNIALGYSGASQFLNPGLYLTGRRSGDPLGQMTIDEYTLIAGEQSHYDVRWGDYSNMCVDPEDGRTFWFTGEYQPAGVNWGTRVGSFKLQRDTHDISPQALVTPVNSALLSNGEQVKISINNGGLEPADNYSVSMFFEGAFVATENVGVVLQPEQSIEHTFTATVDMPEVGKEYHFRFITHYQQDQYLRNDTLDAVVKKLTSHDVAAIGPVNLPGIVCGSETDLGIVFRNNSGLPMQSAKIHWRINNQPFQIIDWVGNLAPGASDTLDVHATGINNGINGISIFTSLPNGQPDQLTSNDSLPPIKFFGNLDGTYLVAEANTTFGVLHWELRNQIDQLLVEGELSAGQDRVNICSDDNTCYRFTLRASTFSWSGDFRLYDIFGNVLVQANFATQDTFQLFNICTPSRSQVDVGAIALVSPVSGPDLSAAEPITLQFRNFGLTDQSDIEVAYRMNGGAWNTEVHPGLVAAGATITHTFATTQDLSTTGGIYNFELRATIGGDQQLQNDTTNVTVRNRALRELEMLSVRRIQGCNDPSFGTVGITVRNNGLGNQHTFDALITVNGVPQPLVPLEVNLEPDQFLEFPLFIQNLQIGSNTVDVDITNVDGAGEDEQPDNDTGSVTFDVTTNGFPVQLFFATNQNPNENYWELRDESGALVATGGPYPQAFGFYSEELCLEESKCYTFTLFDTGGNGMDGGFVDLYSLTGSSYWTYFGGDFGAQITTPFCAVDLCGDFFILAQTQDPTGGNANGEISVSPFGGAGPYLYSLDGGFFQPDPVFTGLAAGLYTVSCLDNNGCVANLVVVLGDVGTDDPEQFRRLTASPNPTDGLVNVALPALGNEQSLVCEVYDSHGKMVQMARLVRWDDTLRGMVILDKAPAGLYYLKVSGLSRPLTAKVIRK
ncbi:MAG: hypothetical protein SFV22_11805 [Saprospiraceae bacterium]|nr:hypothetical protein [Saprospiraceae bacterium]